jgi:hypothetical protein
LRISHRFRFVFLSKPKCASEAIRATLDPYSDIVSTEDYPWFHHTTLSPLKQEFAQRGWDWPSYFVFTTVRNPYTMLNSLYDYGKPDTAGLMWGQRFQDARIEGRDPTWEPREPPDPVSFHDWVLTHDLSRFTLDPFIRDETGNICVDTVLRVETLQEEFPAVAARLRLTPPPMLRVRNASGRFDLRPFDQAMCDRVQEVFRTDFEIGGYAAEPPRRRTTGSVRRHTEVEHRKRAWSYVLAADRQRARRELIASIRAHPISSRAWLALVLLACPPLARRFAARGLDVRPSTFEH